MSPDRCPVYGCGRKAGLGTEHRGEGKCWKHEGLEAPLSRRPCVEPGEPASAATPAVATRLGALNTVLDSCARQGLAFEDAWYISVPVILHGVEAELADGLRRHLRASEPRIAADYAWRLRRSASREGALLRVR